MVANQKTKDAILIDPGCFDTELLNMIEDEGYYIKSILLTHNHKNHIRGLETLLKVYKANIYSHKNCVTSKNHIHVSDDDELELHSIKIRAFQVRGHSVDSMCYLLNDNVLFTGDVLTAGRLPKTKNDFLRANLLTDLKSRVISLPNSTVILPGHGPPTSVGIERKTNRLLNEKIMV